jgi:hypothetical protein
MMFFVFTIGPEAWIRHRQISVRRRHADSNRTHHAKGIRRAQGGIPTA